MQLRNVRFVVRNAPVIHIVSNWKVSKSVVACHPDATPRHATPRHATPRHATPRNAIIRVFVNRPFYKYKSVIVSPSIDRAAASAARRYHVRRVCVCKPLATSPRNPRFPIYSVCIQKKFHVRMSIFESGISGSACNLLQIQNIATHRQ
jgi:hypothetical protein